jgi:hypothetical protein
MFFKILSVDGLINVGRKQRKLLLMLQLGLGKQHNSSMKATLEVVPSYLAHGYTPVDRTANRGSETNHAFRNHRTTRLLVPGPSNSLNESARRNPHRSRYLFPTPSQTRKFRFLSALLCITKLVFRLHAVGR